LTKGEKKCGTKWFLACHRARRLWMTKGEKKCRTKWFLACHRARRLWMTKGEKKCGTKWFLACHRARRLWMTKVQNDHNLSVRVNELAYLWVTKGARMTIICLRVSSGPPPLDGKGA